MDARLRRILSLEVPIIVRLGQRAMPLGDVLALIPGTIIELPKGSEEELDLLVNNMQVGSGAAVKVGENFGIRITRVGDARMRISALGGGVDGPSEGPGSPAEGVDVAASGTPASSSNDDEIAALAAQMLAGQT